MPHQQDDINKDQWSIFTLDDEIRVDRLCQSLLKDFHLHLLEEQQLDPLAAGSLTRGADYFLRNFVIDRLRTNIFLISAEQVRGFAGNWYIHQALEPNAKEMDATLQGIAAFYSYCNRQGWIEDYEVKEIEQACEHLDFYRERIDSFHALTGDDYDLWCRVCPL